MVRVNNFRSFSSFFGGNWALLKSSKNIFRWSGSTISEVSFFCFDIWDLLTSRKNNFPMVRTTNNLGSFSSFLLFEKCPPENHENTTFRAVLEPWGPRDRPWIQEHKILFRIALTRALYDQTARQLSAFYVPGKLSCSCLVFFWILAPLWFE